MNLPTDDERRAAGLPTDDELDAMMSPRKCIVKGCVNHTDEGEFVGDICAPCHHILTTGKPCPSTGILAAVGLSQDVKRLEQENEQFRKDINEVDEENRTLRHERDEVRAYVAALREALEGCFDLMQTLDVDRELIVYEKTDAALSQPNPGAALLERLKAAEAAVGLAEADAEVFRLGNVPKSQRDIQHQFDYGKAASTRAYWRRAYREAKGRT